MHKGGGITEIEEECQIREDTIDGLNSICLEPKEEEYIVRNENTNIEYTDLQVAIESVNDNEETRLKLLKSFDLKTTGVNISENKNIILDLAGYTINNKYMQISNEGKFTLEDSIGEGKIVNEATKIVNKENGNIKINGGTVSSSSYYAYGIYNYGSGTIEVRGGTVSSSSSSSYNTAYGIYNRGSGTIEVRGGTVSSSSSSYNTVYGIYNASGGTIEVSGGTVSSSSSYNIAYGIYNNGSGTIEVRGGTVSSSSSSYYAYGIYNNSSKGSITIGTKGDGIVSQTEPSITATYTGTNSRYGGYGLYNPKGSLYFYDGIVEASTRALTEDTIITEREENTKEDYPEPYTVYKLSTEEIDVARIGDKTYTSLQKAIDSVGNSETTIELLRGIRFTKDEQPIVVDSSKNIILDLKGMTITSAIENAIITNSGKLKVTDSTEEAKGKIVSSNEKTIQNNVGATLELNKVTVTVANNNGSAVYNEGTTNITNATIGDSDGKYAIYNCDGATLNVNEGTITNIYNIGELNIQNITCNGEITNADNANITMTGGTITPKYSGTRFGIYNTSTGNVTITGGTITANLNSSYNNAYGIYSTAGTVNIGTNDGNILEVPETTGDTNAVYVSGGNLNIYDGTLKGKNGAIGGNITEIEQQSGFVVTQDGEYEKVTLQKVDTPLAQVGEDTYYSLKEAVESINGEGTVTILRNGTVTETVDNLSEKTVTIDLNGNIVNMYTKIINTGNLEITDTSTEKSGILKGYKDSPIYNQGNFELLDGTIEGNTYGIYNQENGTVNLTGGTIKSGTYGVYNSHSAGIVNLQGSTITESQYGVYSAFGTTNISGGTITGNEYGIYNGGGTIYLTACTINSNTHEIWNASGTLNIPSGEIVTASDRLIENQSSAIVVIGVQDGNVNREIPLIQAEEYAIDNSKRGTIKFYDGKIRGRNGGLLGVYSYTEEGYTTKTEFEEDGYYADTLALSGEVTTVARIGTLQYTSLQSAINACPEGEETTIVLMNTINSNETYTVEGNQNIIIDLNHLWITSSAESTIDNLGTLRIIDSSSTQSGKVENTTGRAIINMGTLSLGTKDGVVSTTCPTIIGKNTAIESTGTFNFYDGIVKGAKALEGTVTERETGYVIDKTTQNSIEQMILTK